MNQQTLQHSRPIVFIAQRQKQSGATLLVAMLLVLVSTLLGVSVMQSSGTETLLVSNDRFREVAFRAAESGADGVVADANIVTLSADENAPCIESSNTIVVEATVSSKICNAGAGIAVGYRLGEGIAGFEMKKFTAQSTAKLSNVNASRTVVLGAERLAITQ